MDLNAIINPKASNETLLFKDTRPVADAVAKGLAAQPLPATAASPSNELTAVLKGLTEGFAKVAAAIRSPVTKAAPPAPAASAPAPVASAAPALNLMLASEAKSLRVAKVGKEAVQQGPGCAVPPPIEAQRRREAEAREQARKAAAAAETERVLVTKGGSRVRVLKELDPSLSDAALMALSHLVTKYEAAGRQSVPVNGPDLSRALDIPLIAAQAGYAELVNKGHVSSAKNSLGVTCVTPKLVAAGL